jgi:hypothetical protein
MPIFWAGKHLDPDEELRLRRAIALLRRIEDNEGTKAEDNTAEADRKHLELFLPENSHRWTPDELEFGAHNGPWFEIGEASVS